MPSISPTRRALLAGAAALVATPARAESTPAPAPLPLDPRPQTVSLPGGDMAGLTFHHRPGPLVLRCKPGESLAFDLGAAPGGPLALHWMGMRIANAADGAPPLAGPVAPPGGRAAIRFAPPDPGFYWAKPSGPNAGALLAQGLFAGLVVEEPAPPPVDHELVLVVKDWTTRPPDASGAGRVGDVLTVNGAPVPLALTARPNARLRLRLLNACNARLLVASFAAARVQVIAIDGQPCEPFFPVRDSIPLGPGARFELMLDLPASGEPGAVLRGATPPDGEPLPDAPLLAVRLDGAPLPERPPFEGLPLNPALPPAVRLQDAKRADLTISGGARLDPALAQALAMGFRGADAAPRDAAPWKLSPPGAAKPLFSVKRGAPVSLGFVNNTAYPQTTHVRGHVMRLLHPLDDGWEPYWRDSVVTPAGKTSRVAFIADNPGKWLIENADPDRAAAGLSTWFEVT